MVWLGQYTCMRAHTLTFQSKQPERVWQGKLAGCVTGVGVAYLRTPLPLGTHGGLQLLGHCPRRNLTDSEKLGFYCTHCAFILGVLNLGYCTHSLNTWRQGNILNTGFPWSLSAVLSVTNCTSSFCVSTRESLTIILECAIPCRPLHRIAPPLHYALEIHSLERLCMHWHTQRSGFRCKDQNPVSVEKHFYSILNGIQSHWDK